MKTITKYEYFALQEYRKLAKELFKELDKLVKEAEKITDDKNDYMFDFIWNGTSLKQMLKEMNIKVVKNK